MENTEKNEPDVQRRDYSASDVEPLRPEMAFLAENPEAFGLVPDACPLATKHLLVAVNGHSAEGGVLSPVCEMQQPGIEGLQALYGDLLPRDVIKKAGYRIKEWFVLPTECWTDNFYLPQRNAQTIFLAHHKGNPTAQMLVENQCHEAEMFDKYGQHYGYVFYVVQKI